LEVVMHLNCPEEVVRFVGATLQDVLSDPSVDAVIGDRHLRIRVGLVDPDCVLYVDTRTHDVRMCCDEDATDAIVAMAGDTALDCLLGRVDLATAMDRGYVIASDDSRALLERLFAAFQFSAICERVLRREGRTDLLALAS